MSEFTSQLLLQTQTATVWDVLCRGECRHKSDEECASKTHLVFPYRGVYVRHVGREEAVAEANQVLFFNAGEAYRVSHPVKGGDACISFTIDEPLLRELVPKEHIRPGSTLAFHRQRLRIDPRAQALMAILRYSLLKNVAEPLEGETLALTLVRRALGERTSHASKATAGRAKLVDRTKLDPLVRSHAPLDARGNRRGSGRVAGLSHAGISAGRSRAAVSVSAATASRAGARSARRIRRSHGPGPAPGVLQPQPFHLGSSSGLRPHAC